jgi:peptidoglycan LD-endopeptidase CwlK
MFSWGNKSKERMEGVNPLLIECATRALAMSKHDMTIPGMGGVRTAEEQNAIFKEGNSQKDGFKKKSYHQSGNAIDIIPVQGGYTNDKAFRHFAACMFHSWQMMIFYGHDDPGMKELVPDGLCLEWGGHWSNFIDTPHWQIRKSESYE